MYFIVILGVAVDVAVVVLMVITVVIAVVVAAIVHADRELYVGWFILCVPLCVIVTALLQSVVRLLWTLNGIVYCMQVLLDCHGMLWYAFCNCVL